MTVGGFTMKRIMSLILVIALVLSMAACGNNDNNNNAEASDVEKASGLDATISVQVETGWLAHYEAAKARVLEENPDATINLIETGAFDHLTVLDNTDVTNVDVADIFAIPADRIHGLSKNEYLASLDAQKIAALVGGFDNYDAGLGGNFKIDGDYLAFPMNIESLIIFANQANADAVGLDLTGEIEFTDLGYEDMLIPAFNAWFGVALTNSAEIDLLAKDADGVLFSDLTKDFADLSKEKQELFVALYDFWKKHDEMTTDAWDKDATWGYMDSAFTTGGTNVLRLEGPWSTGGLSEKAGNGEDLVLLPINQVTVHGNPLAHWKGGWGLVANARVEGNEDQMLLVETMIAEIMNTDYAVDLFKATGKIMENVSADVYAASDLSETDKKVIAAVLESYAAAPARPLFNEWGQVWGTWEASVLSWAAVKPANVEEAYAEVQASFKAMMENFQSNE